MSDRRQAGFLLIDAVFALSLTFLLGLLITEIGIGGASQIVAWIEKDHAYRDAHAMLASTTQGVSSGSHLMVATSSTGASVDIYDWKHAAGGDGCALRDPQAGWQQMPTYTLPEPVTITDIDVVGRYVSISADSAVASADDVFMVDIANPAAPVLVSALNTGVGAAAIRSIPGYIFLAEYSTRYPLRVVSVADPYHPSLVYEFQVTSASSSAGYGGGSALHYYDKRLYLGTRKSVGEEIFVFDALAPAQLVKMGSYEIDTTVNDIAGDNERIFVASPGDKQVRMLDVHTPATIFERASASPSGFGVQDGRSLYIAGNTLYMGRTVGGFDSTANHELFAYDVSSSTFRLLWSKNIASSVNALVRHKEVVLAGIGNSKSSFSILDVNGNSLQSYPQTSTVVAMDCEDDIVVVAYEGNSIKIYRQT